MPTYQVKGTDILHSKTIYPEGSTIELRQEDADRLADYLELINKEPEVPANELEKEEKKQETKQEEVKQEVKQEEVKPAKPARTSRPKVVKEVTVQPQPETTPAASTQIVQAETATSPATITETKPKTTTQVPPAAQKVIANAVEQVNKNIQGTTPQGGISYQISPPTNMREA